jgi:hypothetical protein
VPLLDTSVAFFVERGNAHNWMLSKELAWERWATKCTRIHTSLREKKLIHYNVMRVDFIVRQLLYESLRLVQ